MSGAVIKKSAQNRGGRSCRLRAGCWVSSLGEKMIIVVVVVMINFIIIIIIIIIMIIIIMRMLLISKMLTLFHQSIL